MLPYDGRGVRSYRPATSTHFSTCCHAYCARLKHSGYGVREVVAEQLFDNHLSFFASS